MLMYIRSDLMDDILCKTEFPQYLKDKINEIGFNLKKQ